MENGSNAVATAESAAGLNPALQIKDDRHLAREAHEELQIVGLPRTNLLLVGTDGAMRIVLEMLWPQLREPIQRWRPGQRLDLPAPGRVATLLLHDVNELTDEDQERLLHWLDDAAGRIRVVSTTKVQLWPRVKTGAFNDVLYYRLNTVCVDIGA